MEAEYVFPSHTLEDAKAFFGQEFTQDTYQQQLAEQELIGTIPFFHRRPGQSLLYQLLKFPGYREEYFNQK